MRPRILVVGRHGQVAQALRAEGAARNADLVALDRTRFDLTEPEIMAVALEAEAPDVVVNTGGFTKVDAAESEPDAADRLNREGPLGLAQLLEARGAALIHLSTDCVFDGRKPTPYTPGDAANPLSVYGRTKLAGEDAARAALAQCLVVRVSWVFSGFAANFAKTMLSLAETREEVTVVADQIGCPTYAPALAGALLDIAEACAKPRFDGWGTYHLAGAGETDRASQAEAVFETSASLGGPAARVLRTLTADYPTPAARPLNSRLDMSHTQDVFGVDLPDWRGGLVPTVEAWLEERSGR